MSLIRIEQLTHTYTPRESAPVQALRAIDLQIERIRKEMQKTGTPQKEDE